MTSSPPATRSPRLCVFARAPSLGRVKSRLAQQLGTEAALSAHVALVERALDRLADVTLPMELWVEGDLANRQVRRWAQRHALALKRQPCGDLGHRMLAAIASCCAAGHPAIVVGSDLPELDAAYVEDSAALLASHDVVIGPTEDGGYGLIGMKAPHAALFTGIAWGTEQVYGQTRAKIDRLGLSVAELPTTWDVDTPADWQRFLDGD